MAVNISIIIPVFNAEKYISECIESLLKQSISDCEFIFVNDGSTDNSESILIDYKKRDSRIKIFTQQNRGVSAARNKGLELAIGKYIGFVDADDTLELDFYLNLFQTAENFNTDVVFSNYKSRTDGKEIIPDSNFNNNQCLDKNYIREKVLPAFFKSNNFNSVCTKLYRNRLIQERGILFPEKVPLGEDRLFNIAYLCVADSMIYIDYAGYQYREVDGSATRNFQNHDYFWRSIQEYEMNYPQKIVEVLYADDILEFKSIKLVQSVYALLYHYFESNKQIDIKSRYKCIQSMISHHSVHNSLPAFKRERQNDWGNFEKYMFYMIKYKSTVGLYFLTLYSRIRNKQWR